MANRIKYLFILSLITLGSLPEVFSQNKLIDSLERKFSILKSDTSRVLLYGELSRAYLNTGNYKKARVMGEQGIVLAKKTDFKRGLVKCYKNVGSVFLLESDYEKSLTYCSKALNLAEEIGDKVEIGNCTGNIGNIFYFKADYANALIYYKNQQKIVEEIGDKKGMSNCYGNIGNVYNFRNEYPQALEYFLKQLKIAEEMNDKMGISSSYNNIGLIYKEFGKIEKATEYFLKSLALDLEIGNKQGTCLANMNLGIIFSDKGDSEKALEYYNKSLQIAIELNDKTEISKNYVNMGVVYSKTDWNKGLEFYFKAINIFKETEDAYGLAHCYGDMGAAYFERGQFEKGMEYYKNALSLSEKIGSKDILLTVYKEIARGNFKNGKYKEAYLYQLKLKEVTDSVFNIENSKLLSDLKTDFEVEKRQVELKAEAKAEKDKLQAISEKEKEKHQFIIIVICVGLIIVVVFAGIVFNRFKVSQKQKQLIEIKEHETQIQKQLLEEKNKEITDSITYAKRLQLAILPPDKLIKKHLPESFVLYKPKDIVAGDFYWCELVKDNENELILIAAADCTGHGVPGAMVSIVCSDALNRTIKEFKITETGKILDKTRELVLETFSKSESEVKDGMDISLCSINTKTNQIKWSGANNPLWYVQDNEFNEIKGHKQPIGMIDLPTSFPTHTLTLKKGDTFYLITDGFADQFGGPKGKKFKYKHLQQTLMSNLNLSLAEQKMVLNEAFDKWKGSLEQVDDVCIIGVRI